MQNIKNLSLPIMVIKLNSNDNEYPHTLEGLPSNYNFEINKMFRTIKKLMTDKLTIKTTPMFKLLMQFPDGLLCYAPIIINNIHKYFEVDVTILNDVVYGACCVDDFLEGDLLIHYGHSCLINISQMNIKTLYIFVEIIINTMHLEKLILTHFKNQQISLIGTIQFNTVVNKIRYNINKLIPNKIIIPQIKPLSKGELLGCTSPAIKTDICIYVGDGRFHLEAAMIKNYHNESPITFYKYCPFKKQLTEEKYNNVEMIKNRKHAIYKFWNSNTIGVIFSTLGKQGNRTIFNNLVQKIHQERKKVYKIEMEEINQTSLDAFSFIDSFVQVGCPRLSIDWGNLYNKPLLNPYEVLGSIEYTYSMDYYSNEQSNPWSNY